MACRGEVGQGQCVKNVQTVHRECVAVCVPKGHTTSMANDYRLNLSLSPKTAKALEELAKQDSTTKADVIRQALALLTAAKAHEKEGHTTAFIDEDGKVVTKVVGL